MRPLWVTAIAGSVLALSACGGGAEPPEAAPPSSSGTPSGSASPSASGTPEAEVTLPAEAQGFSTEAAGEVVRLFFERANQATESGDTAAMRQLFSADCENCEAVASYLEEIYGAGGSVKGPTWNRIAYSDVTASGNRRGVIVQANPGRQVIVLSAGEKPKVSPAKARQTMAVTLVQGDEAWTITTINVQEAKS